MGKARTFKEKRSRVWFLSSDKNVDQEGVEGLPQHPPCKRKNKRQEGRTVGQDSVPDNQATERFSCKQLPVDSSREIPLGKLSRDTEGGSGSRKHAKGGEVRLGLGSMIKPWGWLGPGGWFNLLYESHLKIDLEERLGSSQEHFLSSPLSTPRDHRS